MKVLKNNIIHAVLGVCIIFTNIQVKGMDDEAFVSLDEKRSLQEKIGDIKRYLDLPDSKKNPQAQLELLMKLYPSGHPYHEALVEVIKEKWAIKKKERAKKEQEVAVRTPIVAPVGQPQVRKNTIPSTNNNQHAVKQQVKVSPMPTSQDSSADARSFKKTYGVPVKTSSIRLNLGFDPAQTMMEAQIKNAIDNDQFFVYQEGTTKGIAVSKDIMMLCEGIINMMNTWNEFREKSKEGIPLRYPIETIKNVFSVLSFIYPLGVESKWSLSDDQSRQQRDIKFPSNFYEFSLNQLAEIVTVFDVLGVEQKKVIFMLNILFPLFEKKMEDFVNMLSGIVSRKDFLTMSDDDIENTINKETPDITVLKRFPNIYDEYIKNELLKGQHHYLRALYEKDLPSVGSGWGTASAELDRKIKEEIKAKSFAGYLRLINSLVSNEFAWSCGYSVEDIFRSKTIFEALNMFKKLPIECREKVRVRRQRVAKEKAKRNWFLRWWYGDND